MPKKTWMTLLFLAIALTVSPVTQNAFAQTTSTQEAEASSSKAGERRPALGSEQDVERYQAREQASPEAAQYRGGNTVLISTGAAILVLAIVLLVVLI